MEAFLASSLFRFFLVPIPSVVLGIYIKHVTRNDQYAKFSKEDIAVGFDLMRAAFLAYLILLSDKARVLIVASNPFADAAKTGPTADNLVKPQSTVAAHSKELLGGVFGVGFLTLACG